jgi:hypothetical protein
MMTLIVAAALAAQAAPVPNPPVRRSPTTHEQHDGMKGDCCEDRCKDMADKHEGHSEHGGHRAE